MSNSVNIFGGAWSIKKLECVENYIRAYLNVMKRQDWADLWYIDAFSGDGYQILKTQEKVLGQASLFEGEQRFIEEFTMGSALRALSVSSSNAAKGLRFFQHHVFIEKDTGKLSALEQNIEEAFPEKILECQFVNDDANSALPSLLSSLNWQKSRAVVFIDPFATQLEWTTIEAFKDTCCDVWLLFPISDVLRMLPVNSLPPNNWAVRLDRIFGDEGWRNVYHEPDFEQLHLFNSSNETAARDHGIENILRYATERFSEVFPGVCDPAIIKTDKNVPLFALYSLISNKNTSARLIAKAIADELLKKIE